jgi:hypothetical protein
VAVAADYPDAVVGVEVVEEIVVKPPVITIPIDSRLDLDR